MEVFIEFFKSIPSYSLLIFLGIFVANILSIKILKKYKIDINDFILIETYSLAFGMIGAKALYLFIMRDAIDWSRILDQRYISPFIQGGFVFYGGLIGALVGLLLVKKIHKVNLEVYISKLAFAIPLAHGFGRIGCYLSGCCYGMPYDGPFAVCYHNIPYSLCEINLFPIQLVEAILLFILSVTLYMYILRNNTSFKIIFAYLISYGIIRFILEYFRYDNQRGAFLAFSTSQWISIIIVMLSIIYLANSKVIKKKETIT